MTANREQIGFIGLDTIGLPMARSLLREGHRPLSAIGRGHGGRDISGLARETEEAAGL